MSVIAYVVAAIVGILIASTKVDVQASTLSKNTSTQLTYAIPAALRRPDLKPALFRTTTRHDVTPAEYGMLALADRGKLHVVGGYKVAIVTDARHGMALIERSCCALQEWIIAHASTPPPTTAAPADLKRLAVGGVTLGTSLAQLRRSFGDADVVSIPPNWKVVRYRHVRNRDCSTFYTFVIRKSLVDAISVKNAC